MPAKSKTNVSGPFGRLSNLVQQAGLKLKSEDTVAAPKQHRPDPSTSATTQTPRKATDEELFVAAMNGVQRSRWPHARHPTPQPPATPPTSPDPDGRKLMQAAIEDETPLPILDHPEYIEGWVGASGKKLLPNLRNGLYSIQGQIDLHGFNRIEAQIAVEDYIIHMSRFHSCCVKIIHGRGINSAENKAPLKENLQRLLATRRMARYVVAYASAPSCDGGVGAVYVLLKRQ
ncbi:MAG TPA: Smr/MutS family protein [Acidobacteriota bacterium]|nr:Smr/MutS family protein [Acidobacteriota bacterium]